MEARYVEADCGYTTPCWIWMGAQRGGYGMKSNPAYSRTIGTGAKMIGAHVYYYEQKYGPIPIGLVLDHKCNNRICCNPDHVEPKTHTENIRRGKVPIINEVIASAVRMELSKGTKQKIVASIFGISQSTVSQIARGITWK